jgi:hypothetical protein
MKIRAVYNNDPPGLLFENKLHHGIFKAKEPGDSRQDICAAHKTQLVDCPESLPLFCDSPGTKHPHDGLVSLFAKRPDDRACVVIP